MACNYIKYTIWKRVRGMGRSLWLYLIFLNSTQILNFPLFFDTITIGGN
jgi:hypothetical protein